MALDAGTQQRLATLESEVELQRRRSHQYGNKLTEHNAQISDARQDIQDLKDEMNKRFDSLSSQAWRIATFVVGAMVLAATIVGLVVR